VNRIDEPDKEPRSRKRQPAREFIAVPLPPFSREAFQSQLPLLAKALCEKEIVVAFDFHDRLKQLEATRAELIVAEREQRGEYRAATVSAHPIIGLRELRSCPPTPFDDMAIAVWDECELIVTQLLTEGNPLDRK
jgi:hypothetical protein